MRGQPAGRRGSARWRLVVTALMLAALPTALDAQQRGRSAGAARLSGRVVDAATSNGIAGAVITLAGADTVTVRTDGTGEWHSGSLRGGTWQLRVRALGYRPYADTVAIAGEEQRDLSIRLEATALPLDRIVVTSARREQRLAEAVTTTELVTRAEIEQTGASDVASVLLEQAGIELQGGHPSGTGVMLQGIGSERVLVLLDGQPVAGRISGVFDISRIPVSMVERIEVVKGPQSTLYGTDAMGGVVNIITRSPARGVIGSALSVAAGSQARRDGTGSLSLAFGDFATAIDVSHRNTETTPGRTSTEGAMARRYDGAAKLRWTPDTTHWIEASVLALDERQRYRTGTFYDFGDNTQVSGRLAGSWQRGAHRLTPTLWASVYDHLSRSSTEPRPIAGDEGERQLQRVMQGELLYNGRLGAHALDVGTVVRRDQMETDRVPGGLRTITTVEPFAQLELVPHARMALVPGIRASRSSQWGTHVTPRVATRFNATDALTVRASVGEGYRAPDFKELYMFFQNTSAGYAVVGNADLHPERSRNATVGAEWAGDRTYVRGQLFWNQFRDFIETRPISGPGEAPVYEYRNVDDGYTRGVEVEAGLALRGARVEAAYNGLSTRNDATGEPLLGRPTHSARATIGGTLPFALRASTTGVFTGRTPMTRDETSGAATSWRDAWFRVDARLARALAGPFRGFELVLGADNLFDTQPAEWAGFTGRHVYTALSWTFTTTRSSIR